jgi:hypothetical protein
VTQDGNQLPLCVNLSTVKLHVSCCKTLGYMTLLLPAGFSTTVAGGDLSSAGQMPAGGCVGGDDAQPPYHLAALKYAVLQHIHAAATMFSPAPWLHAYTMPGCMYQLMSLTRFQL